MDEKTDIKIAQELLQECEKQVEELTTSIDVLTTMINRLS